MTEDERRKKNTEIHKILVGTYGTEIGQKCVAHLKKQFMERPIYRGGDSLENVAYKQGQYDLVNQIIKEIEHGR